MKIVINASYTTCAISSVLLPEGRTWADISEWFIKWDTLHVRWVNSSEFAEFELDSNSDDGTDWKRPSCVSIYAVNENGDVDYDKDLAD